MHFPAKGKPKPLDTMDIQRFGFASEMIAKWIQERTDVQVSIYFLQFSVYTYCNVLLFKYCDMLLFKIYFPYLFIKLILYNIY